VEDNSRECTTNLPPEISGNRTKPKKTQELNMKGTAAIGVILLVLGLLAFVVPVPHRENHGVKIGDAKIGIQTQHDEKLPPAVGAILLAGGVLALVLGSRK
jgi:hypothetical protein